MGGSADNYIQRFQEKLRDVRLNGLKDNEFGLKEVRNEDGRQVKDMNGKDVFGERTTVIQFAQRLKQTEQQRLALTSQSEVKQYSAYSFCNTG